MGKIIATLSSEEVAEFQALEDKHKGVKRLLEQAATIHTDIHKEQSALWERVRSKYAIAANGISVDRKTGEIQIEEEEETQANKAAAAVQSFLQAVGIEDAEVHEIKMNPETH